MDKSPIRFTKVVLFVCSLRLCQSHIYNKNCIYCTFTDKTTKLSTKTGKSTHPWRLDHKMIWRGILMIVLRNRILEDTLIETILFSIHSEIGPLQYPENTKLWFIEYHQSHWRSMHLTKSRWKFSFVWSLGQFCCSQQTLSNANYKIFTLTGT